jgi:hypothetical protein
MYESPNILIHWGAPPEPSDVPYMQVGAVDEGGLSHRGERVEDASLSVVQRSFDGAWVRMRYPDGTCFTFRGDTSELWATWAAPLTSEDASTYLLGPVLGYILRIRGTTALHASAVSVNDRAIALVGPPEMGKSTLAAALVRRGFPLLSEDVCALRATTDDFEVIPGYPLIRLWPSAVEALFGRSDALPPLTPNWDKRGWPLQSDDVEFCSEPRPLRAIFVLGWDGLAESPRIEEIAAGRAFIELVANSYKNLILDTDQRVSEFHVLHQLGRTRRPSAR